MSNNLTVKQRNALQRVKNEPALEPWLFKKVDDLNWLDAFLDAGYLTPVLNPAPLEKEDGTIHIPSWPITEYLVSSSLKLKEVHDLEMAKKYLALLKDVTQYAIDNAYSNYRTWWQFCKVLRNLPLEVLTIDDLDCISYWLSDKFDRHLIGEEVSEWVLELIEVNTAQSITFAIDLLNKLFTINSIEGRYTNNKQEAVLNFDDYLASEFAKHSAFSIGERLGLAAVNLFEHKLKEVLDINRNDKWSNIWRNAIPDHKQNNRNNDADDIILKLFRDSLLGYLKSPPDNKASEILSEIIRSDYETIKRIGIYVAGEQFEKIDVPVVDLVINSNHFNDKYRHELWHFLNKNFYKLSEQQQTSVIDAISLLTVTNEESGAVLDKPTAYKQSNWYAAIKDVNDIAQAKYQSCIDITGVDPDHPDFSCYMSSGVVVNVSPLSVSELAVMLENPDELVSFLNEYNQVSHFNEPGIEGLVNSFEKLVLLDNCEVLNNLAAFVELKPHYLNKIFTAYSKLWTDKAQRSWSELWPKIIDFSTILFNKGLFWESLANTESGPFIGDKHWVISSYCRLIESGCENDERAFNLDLANIVKNTLEIILCREIGENFSNDSDAVSIAINSPRGRCIEAYVKLALYQHRNVEKDSEAHKQIWAAYEPIFNDELKKTNSDNEYEFITIVLMYVRNFLYMSKDWTSNNLERMFGNVNSLQWLCAVQAYSYVGWLIPEIHHMFKDKGFYTALLDNEALSDKVKGRFIEYICIAHIQKREVLSDDSLLTLLLSRRNDNELSKVIWFLWSIRDQDIDMTKELVFALWPDIVKLIEQQTSDKRPLASKLALWSEFIEELNPKIKYWLIAVAPYINDDYNGKSFMKELARLSDGDVLTVADIWKATLVNPFYMYDLKPIEKIFNNLIALGKEGKDAAKEIADVYIRISDEAVVTLYQGLDKD